MCCGGGNFPLVLLNKWRSFPWPQMLFSECHSGLICILTVVILTKKWQINVIWKGSGCLLSIDSKQMENSIPDLNCMISFQKLEWLVLLAYCELKKVMKTNIWECKVVSLILNQQNSDKRPWIWKHYSDYVWNSNFLYNEYEWKTWLVCCMWQGTPQGNMDAYRNAHTCILTSLRL